jgi:hypothetical protein
VAQCELGKSEYEVVFMSNPSSFILMIDREFFGMVNLGISTTTFPRTRLETIVGVLLVSSCDRVVPRRNKRGNKFTLIRQQQLLLKQLLKFWMYIEACRLLL